MRASNPDGQWLVSPEGIRWRFDAGSTSLDFAYTGDWPQRIADAAGVPSAAAGELVSTPHELGAWLADRTPRVQADDAGDRDLVDAVALRAAIARLATAVADEVTPDPDDVDTLNLYAAMPDIPPALGGGNRQAGATRVRVAQALSSIARDAVRVLGGDPERMRRCDAEDCRLVFHDESRTVNRRWCSMQRCGNRAKVRAHRARARAARMTPPGAERAGSSGSGEVQVSR